MICFDFFICCREKSQSTGGTDKTRDLQWTKEHFCLKTSPKISIEFHCSRFFFLCFIHEDQRIKTQKQKEIQKKNSRASPRSFDLRVSLEIVQDCLNYLLGETVLDERSSDQW